MDLHDIALTQPAYTYSVDVNGNDTTPEWGYCSVAGCGQPAFPIWYSGGFPDDPDLTLCETHIGARMAELEARMTDMRAVLQLMLTSPMWVSIGGVQNVAQLQVARDLFERAADMAWSD